MVDTPFDVTEQTMPVNQLRHMKDYADEFNEKSRNLENLKKHPPEVADTPPDVTVQIMPVNQLRHTDEIYNEKEGTMKFMEKTLDSPSCPAENKPPYMEHWMKDDTLAVGMPPTTAVQMMLVNQLINMSESEGARGACHEK